MSTPQTDLENDKSLGISILIPTRKRPENIRRFVTAINSVTADPRNIEIIFGIDEDDTSTLFDLNLESKIDIRHVIIPP
jgi:hypothetical protein